MSTFYTAGGMQVVTFVKNSVKIEDFYQTVVGAAYQATVYCETWLHGASGGGVLCYVTYMRPAQPSWTVYGVSVRVLQLSVRIIVIGCCLCCRHGNAHPRRVLSGTKRRVGWGMSGVCALDTAQS